MDLDELFDDKYLHATFHDAILEKIDLDYLSKKAKLILQICVGGSDSVDKAAREQRCCGQLTFSELLFFVIEPPNTVYADYSKNNGLWIDTGSVDHRELSATKIPQDLPPEAFTYYIFVNEWNAFIFIAATKVCFEWAEERI